MVIPDHGKTELDALDVFKYCMEILNCGRVCALATALESMPRVRAMEYAIEDTGIIYMLTEGGRKVRDILLNPNVSLAVWEIEENHRIGKNLRGLTVLGRAEIVDPGDSKRFTEYYDEYHRNINQEVPSIDQIPPTVKLIRIIPDVMELFDPSLKEKGASPKQFWRR